jgi:hypothetical protein
MAGRTLIVAVLASAMLAAAAGAHAQQAKALQLSTPSSVGPTFTADPNQWGSSSSSRSLQWDSKTGHWGLKLDLDQQVGRPLSYADRDIQAGAFYKITPSFRLGGSVSLGAMNQTPQTIMPPPDKAPRVRLETALKF